MNFIHFTSKGKLTDVSSKFMCVSWVETSLPGVGAGGGGAGLA